MNCLWNLRPWLLPREAAAYLSAAIGEQVDEAEILRWALDDQIELSVRLGLAPLLWTGMDLGLKHSAAAVSSRS